MSLIKATYWHLRIVIFSLRWVFRFNIGDVVHYRGEQWRLSQGVKSPLWTLRKDGFAVEVHEKEFTKARTVSNYWGSFRSGYRFYMTNWYGIWKREGIQPWMRCLRIWAR